MGLPRIFGLLIAAYFIPLVGFAKNEVSTIRNPTTSYHELIDRDMPTSGRGNNRNLQIRNDPTHKGRLIGNGPNLHQTVGGRVTIEGLKGEAKLSGKAKFSKKGAARGLSRGLKFGKLGGPWGFALTTGVALAIDKLLEEDGHELPDGYEFNEDGQIVAIYDDSHNDLSSNKYPDDLSTDLDGNPLYYMAMREVTIHPSLSSAVSTLKSQINGEFLRLKKHSLRSNVWQYYFKDNFSGREDWSEIRLVTSNGDSYTGGVMCLDGALYDGFGCVSANWSPKELIIDESIIDLASSIDPDILFDKWGPEDYEQIGPYIDEQPTLEFEVPESIVHDVQNSSFTGPDGATYHVENIAQTDFSSDGSGGFTAQTSEIQNTYKDGVLVDTQVSSSSTNVSGQTSAGGSGNQPPPEIPTDCDLFPTHCEHIEFMEEAPSSGELEKIWNGEWINIQDALKVQDLEVTEEKIVNFAVPKACPAPRQIEVKFLNRTFNFEWTPICTIMEILGYIVLGLAYYVAMRIYMGIFRF